MTEFLGSEPVRNWVSKRVEYLTGSAAAECSFKHLDASSSVSRRDHAKAKLGAATAESPYAILNVGIFGEGTDAPSLGSVAFLEPRKSPIDVIQAVGRAMRLSKGKKLGYIIVPILIPPDQNAENWLANANEKDGWSELGQILRALRSHDGRIETELSKLMEIHVPAAPERVSTMVGLARKGDRIVYRCHFGAERELHEDMKAALKGGPLSERFRPLSEVNPVYEAAETDPPEGKPLPAPSSIMTGKVNQDGSTEIREDAAARENPGRNDSIGQFNVGKSKKHAREMINRGKGRKIVPRPKPPKRPPFGQRMFNQVSEEHELDKIHANLLAKSGLRGNRVERDFNLLEEIVSEAARHLKEDSLDSELDLHFGLDRLDKKQRAKQADGCTIAALLLMNAAMLHQRIAKGQWLSGVSDMSEMKARPDVFKAITRQWNKIVRYDFRPIINPALEVTEAIEDTGRLGGLERALRHIAVEAERIAESYADLGSDHAGPLFNKVMGAQASDGAFFTRPPSASLCARLALDASGEHNWSNAETWKNLKVLDPACGSGTLLAAALTEMKRRAASVGSNEPRLAELQKLAVEDAISGLDINPVSLQLAAAQLTAGNRDIRYRKMGLHLMPYGPDRDNPEQVGIGTLELLGQKAVFPREGELGFDDPGIASERLSMEEVPVELEDAVSALKNTGIVIMNPPFSNRVKMAEKFPQTVRQEMRARMDSFLRGVIADSPDMAAFINQNSVAPSFVALAEKCLDRENGVLAMINPTVALTGPSGAEERSFLSKAFHIDTVLSSHRPGNINLSQHTNIGESMIVARRLQGERPPTRFIALDRLPKNETQVDELHGCVRGLRQGTIPNGWGEVSEWPAARINAGDWTPVMFRSPVLAEAAAKIAEDVNLPRLKTVGIAPRQEPTSLYWCNSNRLQAGKRFAFRF